MSTGSSPSKEFNLTYILDIQSGIAKVGDKETYYKMLESFANILDHCIHSMGCYYEKLDHESFRATAFTLIASSAYIAAGKVYHIASKIHGAFMRMEFEEEFSYYPQLIEESIALKAEIQKAQATKKGMPYDEPDMLKTPVAKGWSIKKDGYHYTLVKDDGNPKGCCSNSNGTRSCIVI